MKRQKGERMKKIFALTIMFIVAAMMVGCEDETTKPKEIQRGTLTENIEVENIEVENIVTNDNVTY
jgi:hypothetical protein